MGKDVSILDHVKALLEEKDKRDEQRFQAQTGAINAALQAAEKAVTKAENATEKRFDSVNEFRQTLTDQTKTFASLERVDALLQRLDRIEGRSSGLKDGWGWLVGFAGLVIAAGAFFFN